MRRMWHIVPKLAIGMGKPLILSNPLYGLVKSSSLNKRYLNKIKTQSDFFLPSPLLAHFLIVMFLDNWF